MSPQDAASPEAEGSEASADVARTDRDNGLRNAMARGAAEGCAREVIREVLNKLFEN